MMDGTILDFIRVRLANRIRREGTPARPMKLQQSFSVCHSIGSTVAPGARTIGTDDREGRCWERHS